MKNREAEEKIKNAFTKTVPDLYENIMAQCHCEKGKVIQMTTEKKKDNHFMRWMSAAAAIVIVFFGIGMAGFYQQTNAEAVSVSLDVNPSVQIRLNGNEQVLDVTALNPDGEKILEDVQFADKELESTVNVLLDSMVQKGYISEISNAILVSVDGKNDDKALQLQTSVSNLISSYLKNNHLESAVLSQMITHIDESIVRFAEKYGLSLGKAQYITELLKLNPLYHPEDLADLSVNELAVLVQNSNFSLAGVSSVGMASEKAYIGKSEAENLALQHMNIKRNDASGIEAEFDLEKINGKSSIVYEVEFEANGTEYEIELDAVSGDIIRTDY